MPMGVTADRKRPLGVHRVQVHRVEADIPYQSIEYQVNDKKQTKVYIQQVNKKSRKTKQ